MFESLANFLLGMTLDIGYVGILFAMILVFSFFPLPSQLTLIPAGYLASQGELTLIYILIAGSIGGTIGAHINYYLGDRYGEHLILKYGKYVFITQSGWDKAKNFLANYGTFSVYLALISPGIGQLASLPAGAAHMDRKHFFISTLLAAMTWNSMMVFSGYYFGAYQDWIFEHITYLFLGLLAIIGTIFFIYLKIISKKDGSL